jgi:hypothetical protein
MDFTGKTDEDFEIQDWQRRPGLKNPLTPEQIAWISRDEAITPLALAEPQEMQEIAEQVLAVNPQATIGTITGCCYG